MNKNEPLSLRQYLISRGILTERELGSYLAMLGSDGADSGSVRVTLGELLCGKGVISEQQLVRIYAEIACVRFIPPEMIDPGGELSGLLGASVCRSYGILPAQLCGDELLLAMKDPMDLFALQRAREYSGRRVIPCASYPSAISRLITEIYGSEKTSRALAEMSMENEPDKSDAPEVIDLGSDEGDSESGAARLVNTLLMMAAEQNASDLHLEPGENGSRVRFRVDGLLREVRSISPGLHESIVARIKVVSGMDIAERRVPQDGRSTVRVGRENIDLRVSSLPTVYGEKIVIRLLRKSSGVMDRESIGLGPAELAQYDRILLNHSGLILIVGPTGSGKSTTLLSMEKVLNKKDVNIVTLEDPVEYNVDGLSQVQINEKTGMTFLRGLKAAMRQDPDIICVGEIRDRETAETAMRAAITGHLVISTLHTGSAVSAVERLRDMGVPNYMTASSLIGVISQRLIRRICSGCRTPYVPAEDEYRSLGLTSESLVGRTFYRGRGCSMCRGTGYLGRSGVFEILVVDRELRRAIAEGRDHLGIQAEADRTGYTRLKDACLQLVYDGRSTFEEVIRLINIIE